MCSNLRHSEAQALLGTFRFCLLKAKEINSYVTLLRSLALHSISEPL